MSKREGYHWSRRSWRPSRRQRQVLDALVEGKPNAEIAQALGISVAGVRWQISELLGETGLSDRQALAAWWRQQSRRRTPAWLPLALGLLKPSLAVLALGLFVLAGIALLTDGESRPPEALAVFSPAVPSPAPWPQEVEPLVWQGAIAPASCPVSQLWRLKPATDNSSLPGIGTGDGKLAWLSRTPETPWGGPGYLNPVWWIVTSSVAADAVITGRRLGSDERARFSKPDSPDTLTDSLLLPAPHNYFDRAYIVAPSPGCWQFEVGAGEEETQITIYFEGDEPPSSCPLSDSEEVRGDIAPGIGGPLAWMIAGQAFPWQGADAPIKTIWLIDAAVSGDIRVTGERIDGPGVASFIYGEVFGWENVAPSDTAAAVDAVNQRNRERLLDQRRSDVTFEGPHSMSNDRRGYIFYDGPGCWRFTVETQQGSFDIVQFLSEPRASR